MEAFDFLTSVVLAFAVYVLFMLFMVGFFLSFTKEQQTSLPALKLTSGILLQDVMD